MKNLILILALIPSMAFAVPPWLQPQPVQEPVYIDRTVTEEYYTSTNSTSNYENKFNDQQVSNAIAAVGAFSMIPTTNHRNEGHGHWGIGVGVSSYNDSLGYALGIEGQVADNFNLKAGISGAGNEEVYGVGGMINF